MVWLPKLGRTVDEVAVDGFKTSSARMAAIFLTSGVLALNVGVFTAGGWLALGLLTEAWERAAARRVRQGEEGSQFSRANFLLSVAAMALNWIVPPTIFWLTGSRALQFVAIALLAGQLIHAQAFGFKSRLILLITAGVPSIPFFLLPTFGGDIHGAAQATVAFSIFAAIGYAALSAKANAEAYASLTNARSVAESANEAKSAFLAMISHELRTPLNGILGLAQALKLSELDVGQRQMTQTLIGCGDDLMLLLNEVLDLSKIEAGKMDLDVKSFDIKQLGLSVINLWAASAQKKRVKLNFVFSEEVPVWLSGDYLRVKQIMQNLVSNALKFTSEGEVRLLVSALIENGVHMGIEIAVQDSGIGMSQNQQCGLFQDYFQADVSTTGHYGGTGLGLSICRRLCKLMSGDISVQSIAGEGSTFRVRLPLPIATPSASPGDGVEQGWDLSGCRILVVDDNRNNRAVAQAILSAVDAVVETAQGGVEALDFLRWGAFDLVLTDLNMPDMAGQELAQRIRRGEAGPSNIPIVALTGDVLFASPDFDAVHPKPIQAGTLVEALARLRSSPLPDRWRSANDGLSNPAQTAMKCVGASGRLPPTMQPIGSNRVVQFRVWPPV